MKKFAIKMLISISMSSPVSVFATGIPTVDIANILQTTVSAIENIDQTVQMAEQLSNLIKQYEQQIKQLESMTGSRGMGALLDNAKKAEDRRWAPENIDDTISVIKAGGIPGTHHSYRVAIERFKDATGSLPSADLGMGTVGYLGNSSASYDEARASNLAALGLSESSYSNTDKRTEYIEDLISKIDTAPDQKAALDLLNTLIGQLLVLQNESIRMQSAILQNQASTNLMNTTAETEEAKFHNRGVLP